MYTIFFYLSWTKPISGLYTWKVFYVHLQYYAKTSNVVQDANNFETCRIFAHCMSVNRMGGTQNACQQWQDPWIYRLVHQCQNSARWYLKNVGISYSPQKWYSSFWIKFWSFNRFARCSQIRKLVSLRKAFHISASDCLAYLESPESNVLSGLDKNNLMKEMPPYVICSLSIWHHRSDC